MSSNMGQTTQQNPAIMHRILIVMLAAGCAKSSPADVAGDFTVEPSSPAVQRGSRLAEENGCLACHSTDGSVLVGPTWLGTFGSVEMLSDGSSIQVDENYLRESILEPNKLIVRGFPANVMPESIAGTLVDAQVSDLISYIKSLASSSSEP
jgi:cytochrome c oxidase subunit 2